MAIRGVGLQLPCDRHMHAHSLIGRADLRPIALLARNGMVTGFAPYDRRVNSRQKQLRIARGAYAVVGVLGIGLYLVVVQVTSTNGKVNWYPIPEAVWLTIAITVGLAVALTFEVLAHRKRPNGMARPKAVAAPEPTSNRVYTIGPGIYRCGRMIAHLNIRTKELTVEWAESGAVAGLLRPSSHRGGFDAYDAVGSELGWVEDKSTGMARIEQRAR